MKGLINKLAEDKLVYRFFLLSLLLVILSFIYIVFTFSSLPPLIPLYNQLPWGPARLGSRIEIFIPLVAAAIIIIINLILYRLTYTKMPLMARMLGATMLLISLLTLVFLFRITQLII